jgi:AcrR family transcriptional regulator
MAPKSIQTAPEAPAGDPRHAARATRSAGRQMRSRLLDGASRLFKERGLAGTSISEIAAAADAFPSQITYYFRTKEALFVEAACREVLYLARATEQAALQAHTPREYTHALAETVTATDTVAFFAEALTLTRRRQDLAPLVERTIERLHSEGTRAYASQVERHGWRSLRAPEESSRRFWAIAVGVMIEGHAMGRSAEDLCAEMLRVLGDQATTHLGPTTPGCAWWMTPTSPTGRPHHDRASHACPRLPERRSIDRRAPARDLEGCRPDRACMDFDIGIDRAGGMVAQPADLSARGRHHRFAPARARDPDA